MVAQSRYISIFENFKVLTCVGVDIFPIPGTTNPDRVSENAKAASVKLTAEEMKEIEENVPEAVGSRYPGENGQYNARLPGATKH
jgi:hypothetical protein